MEDIALETNAAAGFLAPKTHLSAPVVAASRQSTNSNDYLLKPDQPLLGCATRDRRSCGEKQQH
jgi:hypothetical protein